MRQLIWSHRDSLKSKILKTPKFLLIETCFDVAKWSFQTLELIDFLRYILYILSVKSPDISNQYLYFLLFPFFFCLGAFIFKRTNGNKKKSMLWKLQLARLQSFGPLQLVRPCECRGWLYQGSQVSSVQNRPPGWLFYMEDCTTQLHRECNKPLSGIPINQPGFHGMSAKGFERCSGETKHTNLLGEALMFFWGRRRVGEIDW